MLRLLVGTGNHNPWVVGSNPTAIIPKAENVDAAKKIRIDAVLFQSSSQIREELNKRGLL